MAEWLAHTDPPIQIFDYRVDEKLNDATLANFDFSRYRHPRDQGDCDALNHQNRFQRFDVGLLIDPPQMLILDTIIRHPLESVAQQAVLLMALLHACLSTQHIQRGGKCLPFGYLALLVQCQ